MNMVRATRGFLDGRQEFLVLGKDEDVDRLRADGQSGRDLLGIEHRHPARAVGDDRRTVLRRLHDDMFGRLVRIGRHVVGRFGQRQEPQLLRRAVDKFR